MTPEARLAATVLFPQSSAVGLKLKPVQAG